MLGQRIRLPFIDRLLIPVIAHQRKKHRRNPFPIGRISVPHIFPAAAYILQRLQFRPQRGYADSYVLIPQFIILHIDSPFSFPQAATAHAVSVDDILFAPQTFLHALRHCLPYLSGDPARHGKNPQIGQAVKYKENADHLNSHTHCFKRIP